MKETMFIIDFVNGKSKKFDDDRFRLEIDYDAGSARVYSRITKGLVLDIPTLANVTFIHTNVIKKQKDTKNEENVLETIDPLITPVDMSEDD